MIKKILKCDLCLGCGLCEAVGKEHGCTMILKEDGFYQPQNYNYKDLEKVISKICPAINVNAPKSKNVWGNIESTYEAWSTDDKIRFKSSSGGAISSICIYLLENKIVSAVLQVGRNEKHFLYNKLYISRTKEDVVKRSSSRYAPSLVFNDIFQILEAIDGPIAFVGKPCDIAGLKNFLIEYPQFQTRIKITLALFCAGMPSYNATKSLISLSSIKDKPISVKYRGEGWPGNFAVKYPNNKQFELTYNESWGGALHKNLNFRCKVCPDGIGLLADIAIGDAWETEDGYPVFQEKKGKSLVVTRNALGDEILNAAIKSNYITAKHIPKESLKAKQPYQYERQFFVGYRLIVVQIFTLFIANFKGIPITRLMLKYPFRKGLTNTKGTLKRFISKHK